LIEESGGILTPGSEEAPPPGPLPIAMERGRKHSSPLHRRGEGLGVGPPAPLAVEARGLTKRYGSLLAVADFSLEVPRGAIYGLIGPNGAGKTTSMRMLATLIVPTSGDAWIGGASIKSDPVGVRRQLGYMPDFFGVYPELKVAEYLDFYAACHGVERGRRAGVVADLLQLVDLTHKHDSYVEGLSRGMQQRLGLARALVHDPAVLLLDEPASGLDPRARLELREVVRELGRMGKAIMISSHILAELADLCTHIAIVDSGRVLASGPIDEVSRRLHGGRSVRIEVLGEGERLRDLLTEAAQVHAVQLDQPDENANDGTDDWTRDGPTTAAGPATPGQAMTVRFVFDGDEQALRALLAQLVQAGLPIVSFGQDAGGLEAIFLEVTKRLGDGETAGSEL
jgi:ABC-2 type transport system ATP-binding protein